ncbi:MAG TPA: FAD-dependent oxidoreductase [Noviherbaspirillum sp.]|jgi:NAD(P)H-nitrite reductase large subunit|uniref:NAD(P)/FAD-dependent oxidoreductase n=1 Tax=Noviherbaspirillum sp. TaxID=1926288 RepID=UPI002F95EA52
MSASITNARLRHVILGNGPAGVIAAETIRKNAPVDDIIMIGDEAEPPYSRMAIPNLLSGDVGESGTWLRRDKDYFKRLQVQQVTGRAVHVSTRTRTVKMEDGRVIGFDKLLIATGASPRIPFIPGIDLPGVHACWTLNDARRIMRLAAPGARVVLAGAGFIGCLVMEALLRRGVRLTLVEKCDRLMPGMMGKAAGDMIQRWCEKKGVEVHTSARITGIGSSGMQDAGCPRLVRLSSGQQLQADLVIHCVGSVPNIHFLRGSGIKCVQGVVVDASMQTNVPGIYAAGDCAETFDTETGRSVISGVQPNAADQAYCAALNMSDKHAFQRGVRQIDVFDTMGLISSSFGQWQGVRGGQWVEVADEANFKYLRLEFSRDILIGCNAVGVTEYATVLRSLIQHQVRLGEWKDRLLQDPTLLKQAYAECVQQQFVEHASAFHAPPGTHAEPLRHAI